MSKIPVMFYTRQSFGNSALWKAMFDGRPNSDKKLQLEIFLTQKPIKNIRI